MPTRWNGKRACSLAFSAAIALAIAVPSAHANEVAAQSELRVISVDSANYPAIEAIVSVPQVLSGRRLTPEAFAVLEGSETHQVEVDALDPAGLELVVVFDTSMGPEEFLAAQGALLEVPVHLAEPEVAVVRAIRPASVMLPRDHDPSSASEVIRALAPGGDSALVEGIAMGFDQFSSGPARRAMLVVTAGQPPGEARWQRVADQAQDDGVQVYVISLGPATGRDLTRLAMTSGGQAAFVEPDTVVATIDDVVGDLRGQYRLRAVLSGENRYAPVSLIVDFDDFTARVRLPITIALSSPRDQAGLAASNREGQDGMMRDWWPVLVIIVGAAVFIPAVISGLRAPRRRPS